MSETPAPAQPATPQPSQTPSASLLNDGPKPTDGAPVKDGVSLLNDKKPELKPEGEAPKPPAGAPEAYSDFSAPEGYEIDTSLLEEAKPLFKELGLPQAGAQRLLDLYAKASLASAEANTKLVRDQNEAWVNEVKSDPEIGGKLDLVRQTVSKALDGLEPKLATEFRQAMDYMGAGNNPAFVKVLYHFAKQLTEGGFVKAGGPSAHGQGNEGRPPSAAKALFPNLA